MTPTPTTTPTADPDEINADLNMHGSTEYDDARAVIITREGTDEYHVTVQQSEDVDDTTTFRVEAVHVNSTMVETPMDEPLVMGCGTVTIEQPTFGAGDYAWVYV